MKSHSHWEMTFLILWPKSQMQVCEYHSRIPSPPMEQNNIGWAITNKMFAQRHYNGLFGEQKVIQIFWIILQEWKPTDPRTSSSIRKQHERPLGFCILLTSKLKLSLSHIRTPSSHGGTSPCHHNLKHMSDGMFSFLRFISGGGNSQRTATEIT